MRFARRACPEVLRAHLPHNLPATSPVVGRRQFPRNRFKFHLQELLIAAWAGRHDPHRLANHRLTDLIRILAANTKRDVTACATGNTRLAHRQQFSALQQDEDFNPPAQSTGSPRQQNMHRSIEPKLRSPLRNIVHLAIVAVQRPQAGRVARSARGPGAVLFSALPASTHTTSRPLCL